MHTISIVIDKSLEEVFEFTTNPKNTHLWVSFISQEFSNEYPPKVGTIYESYRDNSNHTKMQVAEFKQDELFVLTNMQETLFVKYTYKALNDNKTELTYSDWMTDRTFDSPIQLDILRKLKKVMEG